MKTVTVKVYRAGDTYRARAGTGKSAKLATSTSAAQYAARAAAAKYFGLPATWAQECRVALTGGDLQHGGEFIATLPAKPSRMLDQKGGTA